MLNHTLKALMTGGKAAALVALMGSTALAQDAGTETVIVPAPALDTESAIGVVVEGGLPVLEQLDNDQAIAETLVAQGFTDIHILREGALMTVTAQRAGQPVKLVYSVANGSLVSIDDVKLRAEGEASSGDDPATPQTDADGTASPDDTTGVGDGSTGGQDRSTDGPDTEADRDEADTGADGASDGGDGETAGSDDSASDGAASSGDGSDAGSDGDAGGDSDGGTGGDGSDGGETNG
ncbi:hypothetical protein [Paracoccus salsus]|uniref:hypothetical protein n=1 Tax=Paracoccus salsus TaxID=2911061 RepID=UPI001F20F8A0|nr:hypothetical protein [Paracoccus salsus]MCF3974729.1 hypothetical protein [Paracoccus salsus]